MKTRTQDLLLVVSSLMVVFLIGVLIGLYAIRSVNNQLVSNNETCTYSDSVSSSPPLQDVTSLIIERISAEEISKNLKHLTSVPRLAGTVYDLQLAKWMRDRFLESGLDEAKTVPYKVLLSYPPSSDQEPNQVFLIDDRNRVRFATAGRQPQLDSQNDNINIPHNFNAYSANGVVEGDLVYVYYGREEDYRQLEALGINISGRIVLVRYGKMFRGFKVALAQKRGALGVILYSDPQDVAIEGRNNTYPNSWWMPGLGAQLGNVLTTNYRGDPLTPIYPSIESAYRIEQEGQPALPKILVQPIGYDEAEVLLRHMSTMNPAPDQWVGTLDVKYNLGPLQSGWKVKLNISTSNQMRTVYNTIGILRGSVEPDRYVLMGNHRDSWIYGGMDAASGTASMLEVARVFGQLKTQNNWRPKRTLVFCSWSAEEYGLIGSFEWVQQHKQVLSQRAVAYLNVDEAVKGNTTLYASAHPMLKHILIQASRLVPDPVAVKDKLFDRWLIKSPDPDVLSQPKVGNLASGSDYQAFAYLAGVPSADFGYHSLSSFPTYHSLYDTYNLSATIVDIGFYHHQAIARIWAIATLKLADTDVIPYDIQAYAIYLNQSLSLLENLYGQQFQLNNATFKYVRQSVDHFRAAVKMFESQTLKRLNHSDPMDLRKANDKLLQLERYFIDPKGLPDRTDANHVVFSNCAGNSQVSNTFCGLLDLLTERNSWNKINQHLSVVAFLIGEAARSLNEDF